MPGPSPLERRLAAEAAAARASGKDSYDPMMIPLVNEAATGKTIRWAPGSNTGSLASVPQAAPQSVQGATFGAVRPVAVSVAPRPAGTGLGGSVTKAPPKKMSDAEMMAIAQAMLARQDEFLKKDSSLAAAVKKSRSSSPPDLSSASKEAGKAKNYK